MSGASAGTAVVLGAGFAGLLAARVSSDHFARVIVVERDSSEPSEGPRKGVPQSRHTHGLLSGGQLALERLLPGLTEELLARGSVSGDVAADGIWCIDGNIFQRARSGMRGLSLSRALLEGQVRSRVLALPNVTFLPGLVATGLGGDAHCVSSVHCREQLAQATRELPADLVVDATGRGSKVVRWLTDLGAESPLEERVRVDVGYTTQIYRRVPEHLDGGLGVVVGAMPPNRRCGGILAIEGDRWTVTLQGYLGDYPPADHGELVEFSRGMPTPIFHDFLRTAEPLGDVAQIRFPYSQRRRFERLRKLPKGLVVLGDALCSFNPVYGQGISVAALEAEVLAQCLRSGREPGPAFFANAARVIDTPWSMAVGNDLRFPEVTGPRGIGSKLTNYYVSRLARAGATDADTAVGFLRVAGLVARPSTLLSPRFIWSTVRHGGAAPAHEAPRLP